MKKTVLMNAAKKARIALAVMAVFGMSFVGAQSVFAVDPATEHPVKIDTNNNIVCGTGAKAEKATASTVDPANDIVIGVNAIANDKNSIAIGTSANAKAENSVAIGYGSVADAANTISFGSAADTSKNKKLVNLAAGTSNNDAATYGQVITSVKQNGNKLEFYTGTNTTKAMDVELNHPINFDGYNFVGGTGAKIESDSSVWGSTNDNIVIGRYAKASKGYHSGYNCESNPQDNIIIGNSAQAKGVRNIVMGTQATTDGTYGVVLGYKAQSKSGGIAIGAASNATYGVAIRGTAEGSGALSISDFSEAKGYFATAIGYSAKATGSEAALALGMKSEASEKYTIAIGYASKASKAFSMAIGNNAEASGEYSTAIRGTASGERSFAIGGTASGSYSTAVGGTASGNYSTAVDGTASGEYSTAIRGTASGEYSFAIGGTASKKYSVSIGKGSIAENDNVVSVGSGVEDPLAGWKKPPAYRRLVNVENGKNNHDAATYGQIIKKDTYTISLDDTGNGNAVLKSNADNDGPTIKVDASALETQIKKNASDITAVDGKIGTIADGTYIEAGKNVAENLTKLDTQVKANADDIITANTNITKVDNKIGSLSADGTYIKQAKNVSENLVELDKQVNTNTTAIADKADKNLSNISAAGKDVIINLAGNKAGDVVDGKLGTISSTNYVNASGKVNENISALDVQVKANADGIASKANQDLSNINTAGTTKIETLAGGVVDGKLGTITSTNYVTIGNTVNANISALDVQVKTNTDAIGSLSADGTYIKQAKNVSENLVELDKQVKTNADDIVLKANKDLSNISTAGENRIKDLASVKAGEVINVKLGAITSTHYVNAGNTVNANISALDTQLNKVDNKIGTMTDGSYISAGNTVAGNLSALDAQLKNNTDAIADKADKNLSNITDAGKNVIRDLANEKAGEVVADKLGTITSNNYVNAGNTVNANISKLDEQVKANADAINTKADKDLSNITDAGKNVIKDLASVKAGEVVDAKLGDITSNNYVNAGNTVNANISALDKQMKVNTDNIGDTSKLTTAGLGSNLSEAVVNVNNKVGTADELKALKDAGLGDNLAQATAAVNKKAENNTEAIKNVNGRVDELGGRVDTLGGAVSKLDTKVNKVGAGAAALAALHPMEFDSDNKLTFAAGVGSYHGASAAAIGAFYRPSEQVTFSIAGNMGNGENMVNAGVSFALDRPSKTPTTKAALVKTVVAQNEQIAALNETLAEQNEKIARLEAMVEKLAAKQNA